MEKALVVISRQWHEPFIRIDVTDVGIGVTMALPDFLAALAQELKAPEGLIQSAGAKVTAGMQTETSKAM